MSHRTDEIWDLAGRLDPYWAVLTREQFAHHQAEHDPATRERFFATGREHIANVLAIIRRHVDPTAAPATALDFGCGVGRLMVPLAERGVAVTGVDVSDNYLRLCDANLRAAGATNYRLVKGDDRLSALSGSYDLVHTFIVLQHVPIDRGIRLIGRLLDLVSERGIAALHLTYFPPDVIGLIPRIRVWAREQIALKPLARAIYEALRRRQAIIPMQMNAYPLNPVLWEVQRRGFNNVHLRFSDHVPTPGVFLFCQRNRDIVHPDVF